MKYTKDKGSYTNPGMSLQEWYNQFQLLVKLWEEMYSSHNWLETHRQELQKLGIDTERFCGDLQRDIEQITKQILNYDLEE